jgi:hypothetical protein
MTRPPSARPRVGRRINLPIREDLYRKLEQAAAGHRFTLTNEIRIRLEDSFERDAKRELDDIALDMKTNWVRYGARFLRMDLADQLAAAVMQGGDPEKLRGLARLIIQHRAVEQRGLEGGS